MFMAFLPTLLMAIISNILTLKAGTWAQLKLQARPTSYSAARCFRTEVEFELRRQRGRERERERERSSSSQVSLPPCTAVTRGES